jgi:hypothetical protein
MRTWTDAVVVVALFVVACGGSSGPRAEKPTAPAENDPAYTIQMPSWFLVENKTTPAQDQMTIFVNAPSGTDTVDVWVGDLPVVRLDDQGNDVFGAQIDIKALPIGTYEALFAADGSTTAFAKMTFHRSAPYYVIVTTDWDFPDPGQIAIGYQDAMHRDHPELRITHFVGPYTFTDPMMTAERKQELVAWLVKNRDTYQDEIGLHIHPYCNFVESAGLTCITDQSTVYPTDDTGYTIKLSAYSREQMGTLLDHANTLFEANGLNRTRTFRAGGWTASLATVQALADKGFIADTSALNWARIEEWKDVQNGELYRWNMANWGPINDTSQPYWPSENNVLATDPPTLNILEVPDNGVMIDYVTVQEMNGLFDANWNRDVLQAPVTLMMGFHPAYGFNKPEYDRVEGFLDHADKYLAARGAGPVVYITLEDVVAAYKP